MPCRSLTDFDTMLGHEIAMQIRRTREAGRKPDEWSDGESSTLPRIIQAPSGSPWRTRSMVRWRTHRAAWQRHFSTRDMLPAYPQCIASLKADGAELQVIFGIGRMFHIAFWEPHFAADYGSREQWERAPYRLGAKLHPLTIELTAITSFKSRTTLVPARANTLGTASFCRQTGLSAERTARSGAACRGRG